MISIEEIKAGVCYEMPPGMVNVRVLEIRPVDDELTWVKLENISGKRIGAKRRETLAYLRLTIVRALSNGERQ